MFIDYARSNNGKVLVHCPGVSRSGAIAISYLVRNGTPLLEATQVRNLNMFNRVSIVSEQVTAGHKIVLPGTLLICVEMKDSKALFIAIYCYCDLFVTSIAA